MEENSPIRVVELDVSLVRPWSFFCCPRCGQQVLTDSGVAPCPHLWYMHYSGGAFEYIAPELKDAFGLNQRDLEFHLTLDRARTKVNDLSADVDAVVEFQMTRSGVSGCGPYGSTETVCIDLLKGEES